MEYGGQFENQQRAMKRLGIIVTISIGLILLTLFCGLVWGYSMEDRAGIASGEGSSKRVEQV